MTMPGSAASRPASFSQTADSPRPNVRRWIWYVLRRARSAIAGATLSWKRRCISCGTPGTKKHRAPASPPANPGARPPGGAWAGGGAEDPRAPGKVRLFLVRWRHLPSERGELALDVVDARVIAHE